MDKDLEFLRDVDDKYLDVLVNVMINYDGGKGKIKAKKTGTTTITAKVGKKSIKFKVKVVKK